MIKKLILITGMPGSGKSIIKEIAEELGIPVIVMGDVIREELKRRSLEENAKNYEFVMKDIRAKLGDQIVAKMTAKKLELIKADIAFIDGVRSLKEVEYFKEIAKNVYILALLSPFQTRLKRLLLRNRLGDPKNEKELDKRDREELKLGLGDVIAKADYYIINDEKPKNVFKENARKAIINLIAN
ncbi:MAG: AAA family ATPase [Nitrososphaerales archaeon]